MTAYKINGTAFSVQPAPESKWVERDSLGRDGNGRNDYVGVRQYEIRWSLMSTAEYRQVQNFYMMGTTGSIVASLPMHADATWQYGNYSGVCLDEPTYSGYWNQQYMDVMLLVTNINTEQAVGAA